MQAIFFDIKNTKYKYVVIFRTYRKADFPG